MPRIRGIRRLFRFPLSEDRVSGDVDAEINFHVEARTQELIANGLDPLAARAAAMREFGDVREARAELETIGRRRVRHINRVNWWSDLAQDLKYGLRSLIGAPLFSLLAIATLALGIGANAAVFSVLKSVLLDALPYTEPDRLVRVYARWLDGSMERGPLAAGTMADMAQRQRSFERVAAYSGVSNGVLGDESGSRIATYSWVESNFFDTLGVSAVRGRMFGKDDATSGIVPLTGGQTAPDTARNVVLTYAAWQRLYAGDPGILDRDVRINGLPRRVIGILPPRFIGPVGDVDFYLAFDLAPVVSHPVMSRSSQWLGVIGRLKPGISDQDVRRDLAAIGRDLAREYPRDNGAFGITAMPLREWMAGDTRTPLLVLMTSAALVLLIACANLTGALLSRTLSRRKELAVRVALGAGRGRLVRQLLTESVLLAMAGGAAGVGLAWLVLSSARGFARSMTTLPDYARLSLDGEVMLVSALVALVTGIAFGIVPALSADRTDPQEVLRSETRGASESRRARRMRGALVAGQIALCVSLLAGAGLLARSLWAMTTAPIGFDPDGVFTASVQLPARDYPKLADKVRFLEQFEARLRALPGVQLVAHVGEIPTRLGSRWSFSIDGAPQRPDDAQPFVLFAPVSDDYFRALRIPLRQGRTFDARDREGAPPTVVISETMARRYWPSGDALGARIRFGPNPQAPLSEVIGIVGDVRNDRARPDAEPMLYRSNRQAGWPRASVLLRTAGAPLALMKPVERELAAIDRNLAFERAATLRASIGEGIARRQMPVLLMTAFGALALLLASIGVYAMFASIAAAREREFGLRMALGSRPRAIAGLLLRQGAGWMAVGLAGGAIGVGFVVRLLRGLLYEVPPFDPIALGAALVILLCAAALALLVPLRRATRVDPAVALRQ
jgi:putative ABC transport system permease protein